MVDVAKILAIFQEEERPQKDSELITRAFDFASKIHEGYKRTSGLPYIVHPVAVATRLAEMHMPTNMIAAALLHDTIEDSNCDPEKTRADLRESFNEDIVGMVENVTKLDFKNPVAGGERLYGIDRYVENLRKMFVAFAKDIRAIIIKFADRIENLRDLEVLPPAKRTRIALETLEVYAPIAKRLGIAHFHVELEDFSFKHAFPAEYAKVANLIGNKYEKRSDYLDTVAQKVKDKLDAAGIKSVVSLQARTKHFFSLYKKLVRYEWDIDRIWDIFAVRIIAENVPDCYATLGVIHSLWKPVKGRIKDYISQPKPNGYRSLHTTVFCDDGEFVEFQIRTEEMHDEAQYGIAAHWRYKESSKEGHTSKRQIDWVQELAAVQKEIDTNKEFLATLEHLKIDVFNDHIFVYTPKGDVIDLPEEATPVDFAYAIHSEIGNKMISALVNEKNVALSTPLKSGDIVRITTDKNRKGPSADWLKFVKTRMARSHIKDSSRSSFSNLLDMIKPKGKK